jgi:hypothetical protein
LAEDYINSVNRDGWFPFLLQVTAILQRDEEIFVVFYVDFDTFCRYQINSRKTEIGNSLKIPILKLTFP